MMLVNRKNAFIQLGKSLSAVATQSAWPGYGCGLTEEEFLNWKQLTSNLHQHNGWFTEDNVRLALVAWSRALEPTHMDKWLSAYTVWPEKKMRVAIICAGNIPLVGFHDVLCVLLSGHHAIIKPSSDDNVLLPAVVKLLVKLEPSFESLITFSEGKLKEYDAVIATGSTNTSRYFEYYFKHVPHIIRKSRTSVAILDGSETNADLMALGHDIFDYFGLGCRSVSHLYLPDGYQLDTFFKGIFGFAQIGNHNKYANNYDYNKAVWLLNKEELLDNGFILLKRDERIVSPVASLFYSFYRDKKELNQIFEQHADGLQCIVGSGHVPFGQAQHPALWDYADGVDTLQFLTTLA